jgi:DNA processing protein
MVPSIGPITARKLILKAGSAREVFLMNKPSLEKIDRIGPRLSHALTSSILMKQAENEMAFLEKHHISVFYFEDSDYPAHLRECEDAPVLLYARGSKGLHAKRSLSVVGTRKASLYGRDRCREIVRELAYRIEDLVIVSGLAFGIDVMAHRAALESGIPTVAVLGHGLNTIYPHAHREMARKICGQGALITDFHSGTGPERNNFLRRNRIIAGMSEGTLVVESAASGGALITADFASSYQREVLAVPGRTTDERSEGCNDLIRKNVAGLVQTADDIINQLNWTEQVVQNPPRRNETINCSADERKLLEILKDRDQLGPGELCMLSGLPIHVVLSLLTQMELKEWVDVEPGNQYRSRINTG